MRAEPDLHPRLGEPGAAEELRWQLSGPSPEPIMGSRDMDPVPKAAPLAAYGAGKAGGRFSLD